MNVGIFLVLKLCVHVSLNSFEQESHMRHENAFGFLGSQKPMQSNGLLFS